MFCSISLNGKKSSAVYRPATIKRFDGMIQTCVNLMESRSFFLNYKTFYLLQTCHKSRWFVLSSRPAISLNGFVPELRKSSKPSPPEIISKPLLCSDDLDVDACDLFVEFFFLLPCDVLSTESVELLLFGSFPA